MQPYQRESQAVQAQKKLPGQILKKTALAAPALLSGGAILGRVLPLLDSLVPKNIAAKGLAKIDPRLGKVIEGAVNSGRTIDDALGFIKEKIEPSKSNQQSIIEQYSPELFQFLNDQIQKGRQPLEAGALAETSGKFKKAIKDMVTDHKTPFSSILETVFGSAQQPQQPQRQTTEPMQSTNSDQALLSALDKILKM